MVDQISQFICDTWCQFTMAFLVKTSRGHQQIFAKKSQVAFHLGPTENQRHSWFSWVGTLDPFAYATAHTSRFKLLPRIFSFYIECSYVLWRLNKRVLLYALHTSLRGLLSNPSHCGGGLCQTVVRIEIWWKNINTTLCRCCVFAFLAPHIFSRLKRYWVLIYALVI